VTQSRGLARVLQGHDHFETCAFVLCNKKTVTTLKLSVYIHMNGILGISRPLIEEQNMKASYLCPSYSLTGVRIVHSALTVTN
jgi:hypothetical protein